jgi:hypothetical protein
MPNSNKTILEQSNYHNQTIDNLQADVDTAGDVVESAAGALTHGQVNNAQYSNSGLNTTIAKDSNGNAIGTYDWEAQAEHTAKISYNSDILAAKQDASVNKQKLITNQQQGQTQHDMAEYSANQSAEKAGWTGGYILDSNRQVAFLKESIKANLYSQEELQKYGYDTALAAARANYDLKKSELAMQNYNTAVQQSFQMAELTGTFISPETSFHISQKGVAEKILNDPTATEESKAQANSVIKAVDSWFASNNISKEGVYCISVLMDNWTAAMTAKAALVEQLNVANDNWEKFKINVISAQSAADARNETALNDGIFSYVDEYGMIQSIQGNFQAASVDSETYNKIISSLPTQDAKAYYANLVSNFTSNYISPSVTSLMNNYNATSEEDAKKYAEYLLKKNLANFNNNDIVIKPFNISCKVNGKDYVFTIGGDTIAKCKEVKDYTYKGQIVAPSTEGNSNGGINGSTQPLELNSITYAEYNNAIKGMGGTLKSGQNFQIARTKKDHNESNNWNLELQEELDITQLTNEGIQIPSNYKGFWYVAGKNNYYEHKNMAELANEGTVYYITGDGRAFVIGPQGNNPSDTHCKEYEKFIKAIKYKYSQTVRNTISNTSSVLDNNEVNSTLPNTPDGLIVDTPITDNGILGNLGNGIFSL